MKSKHETSNWEHSRIAEGADTLILLLHGMHCGPLTLSSLTDRISQTAKAAGKNASLLIPEMALRWYACFDVRVLSNNIAQTVAEHLRGSSIKELIIAGHSAGGLMAQSVYLDLIAPEVFPEDGPPRVMEPLMDAGGCKIRLVLIAPLTRGWEISHHLPVSQKIAWKLGSVFSQLIRLKEWLLRSCRPLWIQQVRKGASFLINLRLRWLEVQRRFGDPVQGCLPSPEMITLLGSVDEIISWRDMVDNVHPGARYREVPRSNHVEIVDICDPEEGKQRSEVIMSAMFGSLCGAEGAPADDEPPPVDPTVRRMVFVIHGIRDLGHWTQKIGSRCKRHFEPEVDGENIAIETSSYGYFSMLEFLLTFSKDRKVHWLMEEYVEAKRRFPNAKFTYIGHSNGTYLLADALERHPRAQFQRVVFAGSVVTKKYDWGSKKRRGQVEAVLNFTADGDWVVAFFPRLAELFPPLRKLCGPYLGGAGVEPFPEADFVRSNDFVKGGHGAAIDEWNWDHLAEFAVSKNPVYPSDDVAEGSRYAQRPKWFCKPLFAPVAIATLLLIVFLLGVLAYLNPPFFWGGPLVIGVPLSILLCWYASKADSKHLAERKTIHKWAGFGFLLMSVVIVLWLLLPAALLSIDWLNLWTGNRSSGADGTSNNLLTQWWECWKNPQMFPSAVHCMFSENVRTLSAVAYSFGLYRVLTKL